MTSPHPRTAAVGGALTSSTTLRFVVLLITMVVAAMNIGTVWQRFSPPFYQGDTVCTGLHIRIVNEKLAERRAEQGISILAPSTGFDVEDAMRDYLDAYFAMNDRMPRCLAVPAHLPPRLDLAFPALLIGGAGVLQLLGPSWRIARRRLIRLDRAGEAEACRDIDEMMAAAGVRVRRVWLDPESPRVDAAVFGHPGRRYIVVNRGLLSLRRTDDEGFRAVLHHEFGHLRHHDVDIMHATMALWRCFLWLIAAPAVVLFGRYLGMNTDNRLATAFHLVVLVGVLFYMRNGVLRARELYADADAAEHRDVLIRLILPGTFSKSSSQWTRIGGPHPTPDTRELVLTEPHRLADLSVGDAFAVGLLLMLAAPTLLFSVSLLAQRSLIDLGVWGTDHIELQPSFAATSLLLIVPAGAGVALGIWRVLHVTPPRARISRVAGVAVSLAAGMLLGDVIAPVESNLGPKLLVAGDDGWRWQILLALSTLAISGVLALTAGWWPRPARGWRGVAAAVPLYAYGSLMFCLYLPTLLAARYPQDRSDLPRDIVGYAAAYLEQSADLMPSWLTPARLAIVVVSFPLVGLTLTVVRLTRARFRLEGTDHGIGDKSGAAAVPGLVRGGPHD